MTEHVLLGFHDPSSAMMPQMYCQMKGYEFTLVEHPDDLIDALSSGAEYSRVMMDGNLGNPGDGSAAALEIARQAFLRLEDRIAAGETKLAAISGLGKNIGDSSEPYAAHLVDKQKITNAWYQEFFG